MAGRAAHQQPSRPFRATETNRSYAHHLLALYRAGELHELHAFGGFIELLLVEGNQFVRQLATIGFLEGAQNVLSNSDCDPDILLPFLGPAGQESWSALNKFWKSETPFVPDDTSGA